MISVKQKFPLISVLSTNTTLPIHDTTLVCRLNRSIGAVA
jgi:hypothetical protein